MTKEDRWNFAKKRLAEEFKTLRLAAGLKQVGAAERLGIAQQQIAKYENGRSEIPAFRMDIARRGFKLEVVEEGGFAEESSHYEPPSPNLEQRLKVWWPPLKGLLEQFIERMDALLAKP